MEGVFENYLRQKPEQVQIVTEFLRRFSSTHTSLAYKTELNRFFSYREQEALPMCEKSVTRSEVASYLHHLTHEKKLAPKSIHRSLSALCSYWDYLMERELVSFNAFRGVTRRIEDHPLTPTKALRSDQVRDMLLLANNNPLHSAILHLLFFTGMRVGELTNLTLSCYRDEEELGERYKVLIYRAKGDVIQKRVLHERVVATLDRYLHYRREQGREVTAVDDPLIQPSRNFRTCEGELLSLSRKISVGLVNKIVKKYLRSIGIVNLKGYSAHSARTTLITQLLESGSDIYLVSKEIGHADVSTTQRCYDRSKRKLGESLLLRKDLY